MNRELCGKVNSKDAFRIVVSDYTNVEKLDYNRKYNYIEQIKYKITCVITGNLIAECTTITTSKNKAKKYIEENKNLYLDYEQKMALREEKLERITKYED